MKNLIKILLILSLALGFSAENASGQAANEGTNILVYSFFRNNGETGVFAAWSEDGIEFASLNNDQPIMPPAKWPTQELTRDPSICYQNGKFYMVWTSGWKGRCFGCATSSDLVHWSEPVKVEPFAASLPDEDQPRNMWAPEICWDPIQKSFAVIWSSTTDRESRNGDGSSMSGKDGDLDHRLYIARTTDGKNFTPARLFFDQKFCCIDGQMLLDAASARWILVLKHEKEIKLGGKNLRLSFAPADFSQPWTPVTEPIIGPGSSVRPTEMAEGPCLVYWKGQYRLYWDAFANGHYCLATSSDLKTWSDQSDKLKMPAHPRHGTVFTVPRSAVGWIK